MPGSVRTRRSWLLVGVSVSAALVLSGGGAATAGVGDPGIVHTTAGAVRGTSTPTMDEYLGVPYAEPPTGPERWQPPIPKRPWTGALDATRFGANCPQPASPFGTASTSEDCLHLNVATALGVSQQAATAVAQEYPVSAYPAPQLALTAVGTDGMFACNAVKADEALARHTRVYGCQFSDENAPQRYLPPAGFLYGASHASELSYLFDVKAPFPGNLSGAQVFLADQMQQYWTGFVKDAHPRSVAGPRWPRTSAAGAQPVIDLNTPATVLRTDFAAEHHCAFWNGSRA